MSLFRFDMLSDFPLTAPQRAPILGLETLRLGLAFAVALGDAFAG